MNILKKIKNKVIVSIQATKGEPLYEEKAMNALIDTVIQLGGAEIVRLAGVRDIRYTKEKYPNTIVIGITKPDVIPDNYKELVYITPTINDCKKLISANTDIIAFDGTKRKRPNNENLKDLIDFIHENNKLAMADIATFQEAQNAFELGCDIVSTTLSGYTIETENKPNTPDFELVKQIKEKFDIYTILEGKIWEKEDIIKAFQCGADSVVIGSAITRPQLITKRFIETLKEIK